jgi:hypothetical protein
MIEEYRFGLIKIIGKAYHHDVIVYGPVKLWNGGGKNPTLLM